MVKLIERIREAESTVEARIEAEKREIAEAHQRLRDEDRCAGRLEAKKMVSKIDLAIFSAIDDKLNYVVYPIARGRVANISDFEQGVADGLTEHYQAEGLEAIFQKQEIKHHVALRNCGANFDYLIRLSWAK